MLYTHICAYIYIYSFTQVSLNYRKFTKLAKKTVSLKSPITIMEN